MRRACDAVSVNWYPTAEPETNYVRANWRHHAPSWEERMAELGFAEAPISIPTKKR